jgi:elongation factor G
MDVEVTCPENLMGDIMSDMSGRRGRIQGSDSVSAGIAMVRATVPLSEMSRYAADLRSISQGRASYTMEPAGYEEVPAHEAEAIIAAHQSEDEEE